MNEKVLMKRVKILFFVGFFFLFVKESEPFLISKPEDKARRYFKLSLEEYKKAIKQNPNNYEIIEEYRKILEGTVGKTEAKIELALIFQEINLKPKVYELLLDISLTDRKNALSYIEKRIEKSQNIVEKINLYYIATEISPQNPVYWYNLGKLLLGINRNEEGISALEKAYNYNLKDISLFYYLSLYQFNKGDYKMAKQYINEGLKISDDLSLHKILLKIYLLENNKEMANLEREKIKNLTAKKEEKKEKVEKIVKKEKIEGLLPYTFLAVSKKQQKLFIVSFDGFGFNIFKEYKCTTGEGKGDKEKKGDKRTPEGAYLLISKIEPPKLPPKYGICAFILNYPNPIDVRLNRDGDGIWFHATPIERPPYNSEGCIVVSDEDMKEIMPFIKPGETFIYIGGDKEFAEFKDLKKIKETVENWKTAWEGKNINEYIKFYDQEFLSNGKNRDQWKLYKERINKSKKYIKVELSDLQILPYGEKKIGNLAVAFFKQNYTSDNFSSKTRKILYLVKRNGDWKIICEQVL
ncbi:MAG: L,D-transpeptidase family protein [Candidatus Omnitrophica bacterium]|nr:L,D-transpeptidase family protein [Candidatus Omnitrophota bacterium]MCM8803205.1 L,D-transpeptidase family protein [Candidatus Omnitrophota bacterium]